MLKAGFIASMANWAIHQVDIHAEDRILHLGGSAITRRSLPWLAAKFASTTAQTRTHRRLQS